MAERLRIGILCDGLIFRHWEAECIRQVLAVEGVEPIVVIVQERAVSATPDPTMRTALYRWFMRNRVRPTALTDDDLGSVLGGIPRVLCRPTGPAPDQAFSREDLAAIKRLAPDVLLRFGSGALSGEILTVPRRGIWTYHHGDPEHYRGGPVGFWEIVDGEPVTGAALFRLTGGPDAGHVLRSGWFRTLDHSLSENMDGVMLGSTSWMAHVCQELLSGHPIAAEGTSTTFAGPARELPGNLDLAGFLLAGRAKRTAPGRHGTTQGDEWNFGVLYRPIASLLEAKPSLNIRWLPAPGPGQQRRSPFGYTSDDRLNVLYAKYDEGTGKGEISRLRPKRDNVLKRSRTMLSTAHSLCHPYVLEHEGETLVIPESSAGRVDLYRVNEANASLEPVATLLNEPLCSPTVIQHQGNWWMFGTKEPMTDVALHIYHAPTLMGPWTPHRLNPVKLDVRSARPAGTPFEHEGQLYRPAQDNSLTHGWRVALMRVTELTPGSFREELVRTIGPLKGSPWSHGTGTLSAVGDLTLVDGKRPMPAQASRSAKSKRGPRRTSQGRLSEEERDEVDDAED